MPRAALPPLGAVASGIRSGMNAVQQHAAQFRQALQHLLPAPATRPPVPPPAQSNRCTIVPGASLADLPVFLLQQVAGYLPWRDAQRLSTRVCKSLHGALKREAQLRLVMLHANTGWALDALQAAGAPLGGQPAPKANSAATWPPRQAERLLLILMERLSVLPRTDVPKAADMLTRYAVGLVRHSCSPVRLDRLVEPLRCQDLSVVAGLLNGLVRALAPLPPSLTAAARVELAAPVGYHPLERCHALLLVPDGETGAALVRSLPPEQVLPACEKLAAGLLAMDAADVARALFDRLYADRESDAVRVAHAVQGLARALADSPYQHDLVSEVAGPATPTAVGGTPSLQDNDRLAGWELVLRYVDGLPSGLQPPLLLTLAGACRRRYGANLAPMVTALRERADRCAMSTADRVRFEANLLPELPEGERTTAWQALWERVVDGVPECSADVVALLEAVPDTNGRAEAWDRILADYPGLPLPPAIQETLLDELIQSLNVMPALLRTAARTSSLGSAALDLARVHGLVRPLSRCCTVGPQQVLATVRALPAERRAVALSDALAWLEKWTPQAWGEACDTLNHIWPSAVAPSPAEAARLGAAISAIADRGIHMVALQGKKIDPGQLAIVEDLQMRVARLWQTPMACEPEEPEAAVMATAALAMLIDALCKAGMAQPDHDGVSERVTLLSQRFWGMVGEQDRFARVAVIWQVYRRSKIFITAPALGKQGVDLAPMTAAGIDHIAGQLPNGKDIVAAFRRRAS